MKKTLIMLTILAAGCGTDAASSDCDQRVDATLEGIITSFSETPVYRFTGVPVPVWTDGDSPNLKVGKSYRLCLTDSFELISYREL